MSSKYGSEICKKITVPDLILVYEAMQNISSSKLFSENSIAIDILESEQN